MALLLVGAVLYLGRVASREGTDDRAEIVEPVMYGLAIALFALLIVSTAVHDVRAVGSRHQGNARGAGRHAHRVRLRRWRCCG